MNPSMDDIGNAELAQENFFAFISWDALTQWFEPGDLRDSVVAQELVMVLLFLLVFWVLLVTSAVLFVCIGARHEAHSARCQAALQDTPLARVMVTDSGHNLREFIRAQTALRSVQANNPPCARLRQTELGERTRHA
jgi:hypothetical protein